MPTQPTKVHYTYTLKDFYKDYRKLEKSRGVPCDRIISYHDYKDLFRDLFKEIHSKIIRDNLFFIMPYALGTIGVTTFKSNLIDYNLSKKHKKRIVFLNLHTFGYGFRIRWDKSMSNFKNRFYYTFAATYSRLAYRNGVGKAALAKHIKDASKDPTKPSYIRI